MQNLLAEISRQFLKRYHVIQYKMKKISEMSDEQVITCCHHYCEDNHLTDDWEDFRAEIESNYCYCAYTEEYIDDGCCYDLQMIANSMIKPSVLPELHIDKEKLINCCAVCKHCL